MVPDTRKTLRTDTYRSVNLPESVEVEEDFSGLPLAVRMPRRQAVAAIEERWRIDDEWWRREPVSRLYFSIRLSSGHRLVLYKDLIDNCWYRQSY
ncbi:hypothetical protein ACFLUY_01320 [Chloroflexota bacterium]